MSNASAATTVDLMPTLRKVSVPADSLILDPNNPRFLTQHDDRTDESHFLDPGVIEETRKKMMRSDAYRIDELEKSILKNGWEPVDQIFVRKHGDSDYYVVLEGNRRVTAVRNLLQRDDLDKDLRSRISTLDVMEVVDDCPPETLQTRISYLLGVRHHGSLKQWSPFAQAHNMYERYLVLAKQTDDTFQWDGTVGEQVADALSIDSKRVKERLQVYRTMKQIDAMPEVRAVGGMKARFYSLCQEVLLKRGKSKLPEYIWQDSVTMLLDEESLRRMDNLCHFSVPKAETERPGAPIARPAEWRKLDKILQENDTDRRAQMLAQVENDKCKPSDVWAEREAELYKPRWETWLQEVSLILARVQFGDDLDSPEAKAAGGRLGALIDKLDSATSAEGGE